MKPYLKKITQKHGLPPGSLIHIGDTHQGPALIHSLSYSPQHAATHKHDSPKTIEISPHEITWIDVRGLHHPEQIQQLGDRFGIHTLMLEDILNTAQLPKIEISEESIFIIMKVLHAEKETLKLEQISLYLKGACLLTFQENATDTLATIKQRVENKIGKIRERRADYLLYAILDYIIDGFFLTLHAFDKRLTACHEEATAPPQKDMLTRIQSLKRDIVQLQRYVWYTKDVILQLKKTDSDQIDDTTERYINDLLDHINHVLDISESFKEEVLDLSERYMNNVNLKLNEVMKVLTVITILFMPLSLLTGIYGMNFQWMPELSLHWAYPSLLLVMVVIVGSLLVLFRRKDWL